MRIEGSKNVPGGHFSKVKNFGFFSKYFFSGLFSKEKKKFTKVVYLKEKMISILTDFFDFFGLFF